MSGEPVQSGWLARGRNRVYLAAAVVAGIAALIMGLILANGQTEHQPVIAVEAASGASPQQVHAMIASSQAHHAGMVLLYTSTWQRAAVVMKDLSGYRSPVDVSVLATSSGPQAIASELPATAQVIDANGNLLRAGVTPGGPGLLVGLWACLLLLFAYLVSRVVVALRTPSAQPEPRTDLHVEGPRGPAPAIVHQIAPPPTGDILARYLPQDPTARWEPQCPRCGAPAAASTSANGFDCQSCGHRWPAAGPAEWPNVVLSHRRRHDSQPTSGN